jgi:hypothetical protein
VQLSIVIGDDARANFTALYGDADSAALNIEATHSGDGDTVGESGLL